MLTRHQELVVITKTYNLILWSCHHTGKFPRNHCFVLGERIERNLYDLLETLRRAKYSKQRQELLEKANLMLEILRIGDCPCYVVSKFIEGSKVAQRIKDNQPSYYETTELVATVAEALHHARRKGLVYGGGKDGAEVVLVVIEGGGYTWPGQQPPVGFIGKSAKNLSANDLMWESFQKYKLK